MSSCWFIICIIAFVQFITNSSWTKRGLEATLECGPLARPCHEFALAYLIDSVTKIRPVTKIYVKKKCRSKVPYKGSLINSSNLLTKGCLGKIFDRKNTIQGTSTYTRMYTHYYMFIYAYAKAQTFFVLRRRQRVHGSLHGCTLIKPTSRRRVYARSGQRRREDARTGGRRRAHVHAHVHWYKRS